MIQDNFAVGNDADRKEREFHDYCCSIPESSLLMERIAGMNTAAEIKAAVEEFRREEELARLVEEEIDAMPPLEETYAYLDENSREEQEVIARLEAEFGEYSDPAPLDAQYLRGVLDMTAAEVDDLMGEF